MTSCHLESSRVFSQLSIAFWHKQLADGSTAQKGMFANSLTSTDEPSFRIVTSTAEGFISGDAPSPGGVGINIEGQFWFQNKAQNCNPNVDRCETCSKVIGLESREDNHGRTRFLVVWGPGSGVMKWPDPKTRRHGYLCPFQVELQ